MKKLLLSPLFLIGLLFKLGLVLTVSPEPVTEWYVPFLHSSLSNFSLDPWAAWESHGGAAAAFPYGYAMWLSFLPLALLCKIIGIPLIYGYSLTLIAADFFLLFLLRNLMPGHDRLMLALYWLSPITIFASYLHGFNDLIPVVFLTVSLYCLRRRKFLLTGLFSVVAISAKLSMVLALPFFLIYLLHNPAVRQYINRFFQGVIVGLTTMVFPFTFSHAGLTMLFSNPEMGKVYQLAFHFGSGVEGYLVPLVYFLMLYAAWRVKRLNFDLFYTLLGMSFLLVVLMTPASLGWFIWIVPLLVVHQVMSGRVAIVLTAVFSALYVLIGLLSPPSYYMNKFLQQSFLNELNLNQVTSSNIESLLYTMMLAVGIIVSVRIWRESISRNDFFRLSQKPFVIGVAGDSGAGKDTFSDAIKGLFGSHSVTTLSGDDYHLWDRQKPMWQVMTHLNPMANDLEGFAHDLLALVDGKNIQTRHYDHQTGRMSRPLTVKSQDFIIASGLHALYLRILRECYSLSIFLDIDENLRRHFKLERDVHQRGHTVERVLQSFEKREPDSLRFIRPQRAYADLVFSLQPIHPHMLDDADRKHPLRLKLAVCSRHGLNEQTLARVLIGVCGLHVDVGANCSDSTVTITIDGETTAQDVELAAQMICPRIFEFLDIPPKWEDGITGLMQLITLAHINQVITKRFIA